MNATLGAGAIVSPPGHPEWLLVVDGCRDTPHGRYVHATPWLEQGIAGVTEVWCREDLLTIHMGASTPFVVVPAQRDRVDEAKGVAAVAGLAVLGVFGTAALVTWLGWWGAAGLGGLGVCVWRLRRAARQVRRIVDESEQDRGA